MCVGKYVINDTQFRLITFCQIDQIACYSLYAVADGKPFNLIAKLYVVFSQQFKNNPVQFTMPVNIRVERLNRAGYQCGVRYSRNGVLLQVV